MGGPGSGRRPRLRGLQTLTRFFQPSNEREAPSDVESEEVDAETEEVDVEPEEDENEANDENGDVAVPVWAAEIEAQNIEREFDGSQVTRQVRLRRISGVLADQYKQIETKEYQTLAREQAKKGNLWDEPREVVYATRIDLRDSWKAQFKLPVFNWFPEIIIPDWKPKCGSCGKSENMIKWGTGNPPRLCFGEYENCILNSPQRYCCKGCQGLAKLQATNGVAIRDRVQYSWLATDNSILDQIMAEDPDVYEMFPFHLSHKNGITKKLAESMALDATKGPGHSDRTKCQKYNAM